jgi:hypothetical protein
VAEARPTSIKTRIPVQKAEDKPKKPRRQRRGPEPEIDDIGPAQAEVDREVRMAQRALRRALDASIRASRGRSRGSKQARRAQSVTNRLSQALRLLDGSTRMTPNYDLNDPDLMPEDSKFPGWHRKG